MKRRLLPLLLSLAFLCSLLPAALAQGETPSVTALCVAEPGESVLLDVEEFRLLCRQATGHELKSVIFSTLSTTVGELTFKGEQITYGAAYCSTDYPQLSQVRFTPFVHRTKGFTGQAQLSFTMTSRREETVSGTLILHVPQERDPRDEDPRMDKTAFFDAGEALPLLDPLPDTVWYKGRGKDKATSYSGKLTSAVFTRLPSSAQGALWLNYGSSMARKVLPGEVLYCGKDPYFYDVTFVPAHREADEIRLDFAASCEGAANVPGSLTLKQREATPPADPTPAAAGQADPPPAPDDPPKDRFQDLTGWEWASYPVWFLDIKKAIPFNSDDPSFRPGDSATRMELIYALVQVAYPHSETAPAPDFSDLPADENLSHAAAVAAAHGLLLGDGENRMLPHSQVTRQDALVLLHRALTDLNRPLPDAGDLSAFSDAGDLAPYARQAAAVLSAKGILRGDGGGNLNPLSPITRAEMACLLFRAFGESFDF